MITNPKDYASYLWGIELAVDDISQYDNHPILSVILPTDERIFSVDLSTRTINVPTYLSVARDHKAETVYFLVDRYYEYQDLSDTSCMIEYINADGEGGFYPVPFYDISTYVDEDKMLVPWCIDGDVTKTAGSVQFAIRFYKLNDADTLEDKKFVYNLRTKVTAGSVLSGIDESRISKRADALSTDFEASLLEAINAKIDTAAVTVYWDDIE